MNFEYNEIWSDGKKNWVRRGSLECDSKSHHAYRFLKGASKSKRRFKGLESITGNAEYFISNLREIKNA